MPRRSLIVAFNFPDDPQLVWEQGLAFRVLNFQEDLWRDFDENGLATVNDYDRIDEKNPKTSITLVSNRNYGAVRAYVEKKLARSNLAEIASISIEEK